MVRVVRNNIIIVSVDSLPRLHRFPFGSLRLQNESATPMRITRHDRPCDVRRATSTPPRRGQRSAHRRRGRQGHAAAKRHYCGADPDRPRYRLGPRPLGPRAPARAPTAVHVDVPRCSQSDNTLHLTVTRLLTCRLARRPFLSSRPPRRRQSPRAAPRADPSSAASPSS